MRSVVIPLFLLLLAAGGLRAQSGLTLQATPDREFYVARARYTAYLELRVGAPPAAAATGDDPPVRNVVLVLDRSGSMAGAPLEALRAAVTTAVNQLRPRDILALVWFGSEVETTLEARRRDLVENFTAALGTAEPAGGAALYDALNQGAAQLRRHAGPATSNHLVLLTDGAPTKGPREAADFASLAEAFAREQITISTIGLGPDFNEDLLTNLARTGHGRFHYAPTPADIASALQAELAPVGAVVARDVVLTAEFDRDCTKLESFGWAPAVIKDQTATYRFPCILAGQNLTILLGADMESRRTSYRLARVRLSWTGVADGEAHTLEATPQVMVEPDTEVSRRTVSVPVARTLAGAVISDGLQQAIEQIDKGDMRRALRELRSARSELLDLNFYIDDPQIQASIGQFDNYLAEVQSRGLKAADRKVLRSGVFHRFETPVPGNKPELAREDRYRSSSSYPK
ncbi:MAG TPA: VWA domain-containing protein [Lacunisphaera sp.]|nr:VWA domain-containing protein [Lacunisphaera sp.]